MEYFVSAERKDDDRNKSEEDGEDASAETAWLGS
jgi:hypothetical protein